MELFPLLAQRPRDVRFRRAKRKWHFGAVTFAFGPKAEIHDEIKLSENFRIFALGYIDQ
jgi:hypothetical protein